MSLAEQSTSCSIWPQSDKNLLQIKTYLSGQLMSSDRHSTVRSSTGASLLNYLDILLEMKNLLDFMENILDTHINLVFQLILFSSSYSKLSNEASL